MPCASSLCEARTPVSTTLTTCPGIGLGRSKGGAERLLNSYSNERVETFDHNGECAMQSTEFISPPSRVLT